jgi:hypothetical protein
MYPLLWSYGGREVDRDGKTVLIDSSETAQAVDFCRRFYKETMIEDVLGWTDVNNNKAFLGDVFYWGQLMAAALLGSVPVAIIYSFFVEHYVAGLTAGSVKN